MSINKLTFLEKTSGDTLAALEWNTLTNYVNTVVDEVTNNSGSELEENLVNSVLQPSANEEKNILDLHLNGYYTFDLTYTLAGNLQNPVTQELIDTFRSLNDNILVNSFNIGYLELSVIQGIMNERSVITSKDIRNLANSTMYERQPGLTSLTNLTYELDDLPNLRFFELICSDGILLGLKISGDIVFNVREFGTTKLSDILLVIWNLLPIIREYPDRLQNIINVEAIKNLEKLELNFNMLDYILIGTSEKPNIMSLQSFLDYSDWLYSHNYGGISYYDISYVGLNNFTYLYLDYVGLNDLLNIVQEKYLDYLDYLNNGGTPSNPSYPDIEFSNVNDPLQISNNFHTSDFGNNSEWFGLQIDVDSVWLCKRFKYDVTINITDKDKINLSDISAIVKYMKTNHQGPWTV